MARVVIVTGAAGFAGSHLVDRLAERLPAEQAIVGWQRPGGTPPQTDVPRVRWETVDVLDAGQVEAAVARERPETIYHCAGSPHVASSWSDTLVPLELNIRSTHHLLRAVTRHAPDARVLVPSSALVYRASNDAIAEDAPLVPRTPYGVSKLAQELLAARWQRDTGTPALVARPFNHIGPRQDASFVASAFARQIAEAEAGLAPAVIHVGNLDARRDLTDVRDTVAAYEAIAQRGVPGRVYNVCTGCARRVGDLLDVLLSRAALPVQVAVDAARLRPSDHPVLLGDPGRIERELGWRAEIPLAKTLADLLDYWRGRLRARGRA